MITPAIYLPTTVLIIDDDQLFSQTITELVDDCENFFSIAPQDFEGNEDGQLINFKHEEKIFSSTIGLRNVRMFFDSKEFEKIKGIVSVVIIDNCMKPTNGIEFFRRMNSDFIGKVLITSFPQKLKGSQYINRVNPLFMDKLNSYFLNFSNPQIKPL
jgi:hypothetical protein